MMSFLESGLKINCISFTKIEQLFEEGMTFPHQIQRVCVKILLLGLKDILVGISNYHNNFKYHWICWVRKFSVESASEHFLALASSQ